MASRIVNLAVLAGLVMVASPAAADQRASTLAPLGLRGNAAWLSVTTGPTDPLRESPQIFAITPLRTNLSALVPFGVNGGLKVLEANAALIWATTEGKEGHPYTFRRAAWPPRLPDFRLDHSWETQPLPRIQQRLLAISAGGWNLDVRVYFGTQHPSKTLLASVQAELNRLTLPSM
jgi:hypothetical protein